MKGRLKGTVNVIFSDPFLKTGYSYSKQYPDPNKKVNPLFFSWKTYYLISLIVITLQEAFGFLATETLEKIVYHGERPSFNGQ